MAKKNGGDGVYRVIDVIGTSKTSWEDAAKNAVDAELRAYVRERVAPTGVEVTELGVKDVILPGDVRALGFERALDQRTDPGQLCM